MSYSSGRISIILLAAIILIIFQTLSYGAVKGLEIIKSDENELILSYKPVVEGYNEIITENGTKTYIPIIEGSFSEGNSVWTSAPGEPIDLQISENITVPGKDLFSLADFKIKGLKKIHKMMAPSPTPFNNNDLPESKYIINELLYKSHNPDMWVMADYEGIARSRHILKLRLKAASYNGLEKAIIIPEEIYIHLKFKAPAVRSARKVKDEFDPVISINHNVGKKWLVNPVPYDRDGGKKIKSDITLENSSNWVKIGIEKEGLYKIDPGMLSNLGITIPKDQVNTIKIYGNGGRELSESVSDAKNNKMNEQAIIVNTNSGGSLKSILFYGAPGFGFAYDDLEIKHYINHYSPVKKISTENTEKNYYLLTWGGSQVKRAVYEETPAEPADEIPQYYYQRIFYEEEITNAFVNGSGRDWFGSSVFPRKFTNQLHNLYRDGKIFYRLSVAQRASEAGEFKVQENGVEIADIPLSGVSIHNYEDAYRSIVMGELPANMIASDGRSILNFDYSNPEGPRAVPFFDYYEIHYPRYFIPVDNEISFITDPDYEGIYEFNINQFGGSEIYGFDVTNLKNPEMIENLAATGGIFKFKTGLVYNSPKKFFISSKTREPELSKVIINGIRNDLEGSDVIVIAHPDLMNSAEKYADYRTKQSNLRVKVFSTEDIYNEFGSGLKDPTAIRNFIAYAYFNWKIKPGYVLLWGDGHYDYKNIQSNATNFVPPYESLEYGKIFDAIDSYTTDDYFVRIDGEDRLNDIALGRIPINSDEAGDYFIEKLDAYENHSDKGEWRATITLVADDGKKGTGTDGNQHTNQSEILSRNYVPVDMQQKKIYLPMYPTENIPGGRRKPACTEDILSSINVSGTILLNWIGHGNPRVWAHEEVLERGRDLPKMINKNKLYFLTAATCDYGRFDMPDVRSGAEEMLLSRQGGAIGCMTSARVVFSSSNAALNEVFWTNLFKRDSISGETVNLGTAFYKMKQERAGTNDEKFGLMSDPTLKLLIPEYRVSITRINGIDVENNSDTLRLKALSDLKIEGRILPLLSDETDETFNGTAIITMLDGDDYVEIPDEDGVSTHYVLQHGGALNRSSYPVVDGKFTAEFVIPKDISYSDFLGRMYAYAISDDDRYARGAFRDYVIDGVTTGTSPDDKSPDISIYLDGRNFKSGDVVSDQPLLIVDLYDESGLNTTGNGIGHKIEAWLDDNPNSYDLTSSFKTSLDDPKKGTAEDYLDQLEPGYYRIRVRAWDVYNNYSVKDAFFRVAPKGEIVLSELLNYPNPFESSTTIRFDHNLSPPFEARVDIHSVTGNLVKRMKSTVTSSHTAEFNWDGKDEYGKNVAQGAYIFNINVHDSQGNRANKAGIMTLIR